MRVVELNLLYIDLVEIKLLHCCIHCRIEVLVTLAISKHSYLDI